MNVSTLRTLSRDLVRQLGMLDKQCGDVELSPVQAHCLIELEQCPLTVNQVAQKLHVDKSNASRTLKSLASKECVEVSTNKEDKRSILYALTPKGEKQLAQLNHQQNARYQAALNQLSAEEKSVLHKALESYTRALETAEASSELTLRPIRKSDNAALATIIRQVSEEHGLSSNEGFSVADPTLEFLYDTYSQPRSQYWVIESNGRVIGGGGYAPLQGKEEVCELQKMYFLPEARGKGLSKTIAKMAMEHASQNGFSQCYLETTACLKAAIALYEKLGFEHLDAPWGNTGHDACEVAMAKAL
ncbi:putative Bacterial regulatory protein MarR fused with Acyl-CoA N-acyltransferase [Vibrio nigripulchritudo SOn1]|uniref:Bacterial regulatory protein MarR fused with Acyl-CoA N-acyltransferase n=1 Tax=Vibrio nigripulchritudo SOn1 TaxID=1238450 RepID=A0AAV2VL29_9VIBR|nr:bifunctional helix-turn-helix transcriptional regulator/GNAT family N-acetyltransferase [Vibrio nigripulchritudo]CCO45365.1 putative Bacterial regulatory protein MarR fused with Acyl-CoA N-acyltransferase [Vibrio nigripulchritudo SOn1]